MRRIVIADASPMFRDAAAHLISSLPGYTLAGTSTTSQQTLSLVESAGPDICSSIWARCAGSRRCAA